MAQFKAFAHGVSVNGETVLSVLDGMGGFKKKALQILSEKGIVDPQPGLWYPQQAWLDAFKEISDSIGKKTLFEIGKTVPNNAQWPQEIDSLEIALDSIDQAYHMNHKDGEIGHYHFQKTGDNSGTMVCKNPYPCEFDFGIITAVARKFKPSPTTVVSVKHDDSANCRRKGDDSCTYLITW
ncbi:MAG: hypothetical protein GX878_05045 [Firmicutes bacterium]|nr:hypothetical protein [Bacillota bacterium]